MILPWFHRSRRFPLYRDPPGARVLVRCSWYRFIAVVDFFVLIHNPVDTIQFSWWWRLKKEKALKTGAKNLLRSRLLL